jgi:hypothetical protein
MQISQKFCVSPKWCLTPLFEGILRLWNTSIDRVKKRFHFSIISQSYDVDYAHSGVFSEGDQPFPEHLTHLVKKYLFTSNFLIFLFTYTIAFLTVPTLEQFRRYAIVCTRWPRERGEERGEWQKWWTGWNVTWKCDTQTCQTNFRNEKEMVHEPRGQK